jgi:hypothetical protein
MGNNRLVTTKYAGELLVILMVHHLIEHIQGFTWSHWMPPSGKCLRCVAPAATMVDEFV